MFLSFAFQPNVVGLFNYNTEGQYRGALAGDIWAQTSDTEEH
jgi:hypothetical protein